MPERNVFLIAVQFRRNVEVDLQMPDDSSGGFPRPLNERERDLFLWCTTLLDARDATALREQVKACLVVDADDDGYRFKIAPEVAPVTIKGVDLAYDDDDGERVEFMIAFVNGRLSWVDYYRPAADSVPHKRMPAPSDLLSAEIAE